jgi:hypothetical protein
MKNVLISLLLIAGTSCVEAAALFGPNNYEDCILEGMKGVNNDLAAKAVVMACARKFQASSGHVEKGGASKKVMCGGQEVDKAEAKQAKFPVPNEFGQLKIVKLAWEKTNTYSETLVFRIYIQHSYPFDIEEIYLQGFQSNGLEDASYYCFGRISANALGYAQCANVQDTSKTFNVKSIVTPSTNLLQLLKKLKKC